MTLIDQQDRDQALDPSGSFIVQAPAGSGKTGLLVRRLLALLGVVEKPEEILAITFTRKATAEMRERVIGALHKVKTGAEFEEHEQDMAEFARRALARNREKQWLLLEQPHRLRIQTIDSLCAELVRKMPWSTRFGAVPQVETDLQELYRQAATGLLKRLDLPALQPALSTLLMHNNGDVLRLRNSLAGMLYQREKWLKLIFRECALDSRDRIEQHWQQAVRQLLDELETECGESLALELFELLRYAENNLPLPQEESDHKIQAALDDESRKPDLDTRMIRWRLIAQLLFTTQGQFRKSVNKNNGFPDKNAYKNRMQEILKELQSEDRLRETCLKFLGAPDPRLHDDEWHRLEALRRVLPALAQELYLLMVEKNCTDYDELSRRAIDALGTPEQPTDLALLQDYRIHHILMDEFQDTSAAQLELLERLTGGWQHEDSGRSLFLVGDPMQSIYGFRNADVRVFLKVRDEGINDIHPRFLELKVNFRSSTDIIDWVNQVMPGVFPDKDVPELARVRYSPSVAQLTHEGTILTHLCVADSDQNAEDYRYGEAWRIRDHIVAIRRRCPQDTIAILARKRSPLASLAEVLRKSGIDFEAVDLESLSEQSVVQDLICLAGVFINPMDTLSWLSVLRAPWCGLSLADLTLMRESGSPLYALVQESNTNLELSPRGAEILNRLRTSLLTVFAFKKQEKISSLLRRAWLSLRGPACYDAHALAYVEPFFEMLHALESESSHLSRERLLEASEIHRASSPSNRIQLMTYHKAKGLEFDHVILTGLAGISSGDQRSQPLIQSTKIGGALLVAPSPAASDPDPTKAGFIRRHLQSIEDEESARLLYVAVTRARKHLALFATLKRAKDNKLQSARKGSLLSLLWPALEENFSLPENQSDIAPVDVLQTQKEKSTGIPLLSLPATLPPVELPEPIRYTPVETPASHQDIEFSWAQEEARIVGLVVHAVLEHANREIPGHQFTALEPGVIEAKLKRHGISPERITGARMRIHDILSRISRDKRAHWIFDPKHRSINSEWALSSNRAGRIIRQVIDRSFIDSSGIRWIIDFKTSSHEGGNLRQFLDEEEQRYAPQLDQYAELISALDPGREIRLGLYFPALGQWRERAYRPSVV